MSYDQNWSPWHRFFALWPVELEGGGWAWLRMAEFRSRWNWDLNPWIDNSGWSGTDGGTEYQHRAIPTNDKEQP